MSFVQVDFKVMCENAMIYNKPDTIYHKAARKLLHSGMKVLSQVGSQGFAVRCECECLDWQNLQGSENQMTFRNYTLFSMYLWAVC